MREKMIRWPLTVRVVAAFWCLVAAAEAASITSTPFRGVTLTQRTETSPRPLKINIVEIDLDDPGIQFRVTSPNGELPEETTRQTTRSFLTQQNAQIAINGSFYDTFGAYANNVSLAASDGNAYSPFGSGFRALNITDGNSAAIVKQMRGDTTGFTPDPTVDIYNAVAGNAQIVTAGANTGNSGVNTPVNDVLNPRTAAGTATGNRLVLMTVDGRQPGVSEGVTTLELADLLLDYGVIDAINLDGGGSTTMVIADPAPRVLNVPSDGSERAVGTNLAVFAAPVPEPSAVLMVLTAGLVAGSRRRRRAAA